MNIEEAVATATEGAIGLLSCLCQPVVTYHLTAIMREADANHARELQEEFLRRSVEALISDGLEGAAAEQLVSRLAGRVGLAWSRLHTTDGTRH